MYRTKVAGSGKCSGWTATPILSDYCRCPRHSHLGRPRRSNVWNLAYLPATTFDIGLRTTHSRVDYLLAIVYDFYIITFVYWFQFELLLMRFCSTLNFCCISFWTVARCSSFCFSFSLPHLSGWISGCYIMKRQDNQPRKLTSEIVRSMLCFRRKIIYVYLFVDGSLADK